jgi:hypothetical protein
MDAFITFLAILAALLLALALAFVPLRVAVGAIAKNVRAFIQRQRDRRSLPRDTPDRRRSA